MSQASMIGGVEMTSSVVPARKLTVRALLGAWRSRAWIMDGRERSGGEPLRLFFAGGEKQKEYLSRIAFGGPVQERYLGEQSAWRTIRMLWRNRAGVDITMVEGSVTQDYLYRRRGDRVLPMWLKTVVDIPLVASNGSAREDVRRIRTKRLDFDVTTDLARVDDFYQNIYRPSILASHGDSAIEITKHHLVSMFQQGRCELLAVTQAGQTIAGVLIIREPIPRLWCNGVRDADPIWRRAGAIPASYIFASQYLAKQGCRQMDMGLSRGFLADGVLRYKTKWNHRITGCTSIGFLLRICTVTAGTRAFLCANPFVYREGDRLYGAVFVDPGSPGASLDPVTACARYRVDGLAGVNLFSADVASSHLAVTIPS